MANTFLDFKIFVYNFVHLFLKPTNRIFFRSELPSSEEIRITDYDTITGLSGNIILTTYFSTKVDPQSQNFVKSNDFKYIREFYQSVAQHQLNAVIFHDHLNEEFIAEYSTPHIKFVRSKVLKYSLNDERFYLYKEFIQNTDFEKILLCDINDVTFGKNPFDLIGQDKIYIGRDTLSIVGENGWIQNKFSILPLHIKSKLPFLFGFMPLVNAGVIGGDCNTVSSFVRECCAAFDCIDNELNNNMAVVNMVFFNQYWLSHSLKLSFKARLLNEAKKNKLRIDKCLYSKNFHIGYPFTSQFKKYENVNEIFIFHK